MSSTISTIFFEHLAASHILIDPDIEEYISLALSSSEIPFTNVDDIRDLTEQILRDAGTSDEELDQFYNRLAGVDGLNLQREVGAEANENASDAFNSEEDDSPFSFANKDSPFLKDGLSKTSE